MKQKTKAVLVAVMLLTTLQIVSATTLLYQDFEDATFPPTNWTTATTGSLVAWVRRTSGLIFGSGSGGVRIFGPQSGGNFTGTSYLRTPSMDFSSSGVESLRFYFRLPGLTDLYGIASALDTMKIEVSTNGTNWTAVKVLDSNYVSNLPNQTAIRDSGCKISIGLGAYNGQGSVYIRWMFYDNYAEGATGTNRYFNIDSVYVYDVAAGIEEERSMMQNTRILEIRPNPFRTGNVILSAAKNLNNVKIYDMTGNLIQTLNTNSSDNVIRWDGRNQVGDLVQPGVYFVVLETKDNQRKTGKILFSR